jgi:hypothetical protein
MTIIVSKSVVVPVSALVIAAVVGCGGGSSPAASSGHAGEGNSSAGTGTSAGAGGSSSAGAGNSAGTGNTSNSDAGAGVGVTTPGPLNPTDCKTPGGTPSGVAVGTAGTWENVSPKAMNLDPTAFNNDNFGVQDVLVDPVRPSDVYTFVCHQGVWKSTDYGGTWAKVNTGLNGPEIDTGKPWGSGIDSNRCRDPNTPPTLYTLNGGGQLQGFFKSTDGGVSWTHIVLPNQTSTQYPQDAYSIAVDPYDGNHLLMGFHEAVGLVESNDGGVTWVVHKPADAGVSVYNFFVDTGNAATTRATWLSVAQESHMFRTTDSGSTWTEVETLQHGHGCSQLFQAGSGVIYVPGLYGSGGNGVYRSADYGATWSMVFNGVSNNVNGTATTLYANYGWADAGGVDPSMQTAPRTAGTPWTATPAPAGMTNGSKGSAVTFDGTHHIVIDGNWAAGLWRYIEP